MLFYRRTGRRTLRRRRPISHLTGYIDLNATEGDVTIERRRIEPDKSRGEWNLAGELVIGHIEESKAGLVERRDFSVDSVVLQVELVETGEIEERGWNLS